MIHTEQKKKIFNIKERDKYAIVESGEWRVGDYIFIVQKRVRLELGGKCVCNFMEAGSFTQQVFGQTFVELRYNQLMVFFFFKEVMSIKHFVYYTILTIMLPVFNQKKIYR